MKNRIAYMLGAGVVVAGLVVAQTPQVNTDRPARGARWAQGQGAKKGGPMGRMARNLELTDNQKTQAQAIFKASADNAKPAALRMREARQALQTAAKDNAPPEQINKLASEVGALQGQLAASRAQAFAQFYQILTPEQRQKVDARKDGMKNRQFRQGAFRQGMKRGGGTAEPQQQ